MYFDILGEIARPGRYTIDKDKMTLLDALGMAGDLSILGQRCNVKIIRNEDGGRKVYEIDMTSGNSVLNSPVFYIQQNDVLYVEANNYRKRQSIVAGNTVMTPSFWMSVASFLTSMYVIWVK
jgi:polysaccharide export outer membrane protein